MLGGFLSWGKAVNAAMSLANKFADYFREKKIEEVGAMKQREKDRRKADEAQNRMDDVEPSGRNAAADRLRDGKF